MTGKELTILFSESVLFPAASLLEIALVDAGFACAGGKCSLGVSQALLALAAALLMQDCANDAIARRDGAEAAIADQASEPEG